ncbi:MAG: RimK family protein [Xanthomonadales bacterium]|nr:RimK family protein [Xanthomonadales bacterium]
MSRLLIVVERMSDWGSYYPSENVMPALEYLRMPIGGEEPRTQVINLCRSSRYLGLGYYVSLLAEARGHRVIPSVRTLNDLRRKSVYGLDVADLNTRLRRYLPAEGRDATEFSLLVYFGETASGELADLARQIFEAFPAPILRIGFERQKVWQISQIRPVGLAALHDEQEDAFAAALERFSRKIWRKPRARRRFRYDLAMLHDPAEEWPPSDRKALANFVRAGRALGVEVDLITRQDYARLAEYDALFIRETTALDHHTYRFAHKAEREGMVVIDDPTSILKCTNKIYLADLLKSRKLPAPRTEIIDRDDLARLQALPELLGFPIVLKIPDGSFSRGVVKAENPAELEAGAQRLFEHTALLLAQEYLYTDFDWRIGVLNGQPLFACQYFMSRGHWQVYNHQASGGRRHGKWKTMAVREAPAEVVRLALKACSLIGDGLYGVDLKQVGDRVVIIEVNDNPSIEAGVEDAYLGEDLYRRIIEEFVRRLERKRLGIGR